MPSPLRRMRRCFAAAAILALPAASHASVLDFEDPELTGLYFAGESFEQAGFRFSQGLDAAIVDVGSALGPAAPGNNTSQFYTSLNNGFLRVASLDGSAFSFEGFSAAFVPQTSAASSPIALVLVALGTTVDGSRYSTYFSLGDTTQSSASFAFRLFDAPADFSQFGNLLSLEFFTCATGPGPVCRTPTENQGQFALDDIRITAVPEPSPFLMLSAGLAVLAWMNRRRSR